METEIQIYSIISLLSYDKCLVFKYAWSRIACYMSLFSHTKCLDTTFTSENYSKFSVIVMDLVVLREILLKVVVHK